MVVFRQARSLNHIIRSTMKRRLKGSSMWPGSPEARFFFSCGHRLRSVCVRPRECTLNGVPFIQLLWIFKISSRIEPQHRSVGVFLLVYASLESDP